MGSFKFADRTLTLEIEEKEYSFICDSRFGDAMKKYAKKSEEYAQRAALDEADVDDAIALCKNVINEVLGGGSFDKIFENREPSLSDCADLINFIAEEVRTFTQKTQAKYMTKVPKHAKK